MRIMTFYGGISKSNGQTMQLLFASFLLASMSVSKLHLY